MGIFEWCQGCLRGFIVPFSKVSSGGYLRFAPVYMLLEGRASFRVMIPCI